MSALDYKFLRYVCRKVFQFVGRLSLYICSIMLDRCSCTVSSSPFCIWPWIGVLLAIFRDKLPVSCTMDSRVFQWYTSAVPSLLVVAFNYSLIMATQSVGRMFHCIIWIFVCLGCTYILYVFVLVSVVILPRDSAKKAAHPHYLSDPWCISGGSGKPAESITVVSITSAR